MIRLEGGVLVLDAPISKEDAQAVQEFAKHIKEQEQERIIKLIEKLDGWDWIEIPTEDLIALIKED